MSRTTGDLRSGDTVWLTPRSVLAPPVCYGEPRATVVRLETPYVVVTVDGRECHIHQDHIRLSDPRKSPGAARPVRRVRSGLDGAEEMPLF